MHAIARRPLPILFRTLTLLAFLCLPTAVLLAQTGLDQVARGCELYEQASFEEAIQTLEAALEQPDLSPAELQQARVCLARAYVKTGKRVRAKLMFGQILQANPDWRPDQVYFPPDETQVFDQALREFGEEEPEAAPPPREERSSTQTTLPTPAPAPSPTKSSPHQLRVYGGVGLSSFRGDADQLGNDVVAGLNTELGGNWSFSTSSVAGPALGVGYSYQATPNLAIGLEAGYRQRGARYEFSDGSGMWLDIQQDWKLKVLEAALLLRLGPSLQGPIHPVLLLGPAFGIISSADLETSSGGGSPSSESSDELFKGVSIGAVLGGGLDLELGPSLSFFGELRYVLGLNDVSDDPAYELKVGDLEILGGLAYRPGP